MNYKETTFLFRLKKFGIKRIFLSTDFLLAFVVAIILSTISYHYNLTFMLLEKTSAVYPIVATGMIALIITSLAIITAIPDDNFIKFLKQAKIYENLLFMFWLISIVAGISIVVDISVYLVYSTITNNMVGLVFLWLSTLLTSYALFAAIQTIGDIIRYGLYRADFIK